MYFVLHENGGCNIAVANFQLLLCMHHAHHFQFYASGMVTKSWKIAYVVAVSVQ